MSDVFSRENYFNPDLTVSDSGKQAAEELIAKSDEAAHTAMISEQMTQEKIDDTHKALGESISTLTPQEVESPTANKIIPSEENKAIIERAKEEPNPLQQTIDTKLTNSPNGEDLRDIIMKGVQHMDAIQERAKQYGAKSLHDVSNFVIDAAEATHKVFEEYSSEVSSLMQKVKTVAKPLYDEAFTKASDTLTAVGSTIDHVVSDALDVYHENAPKVLKDAYSEIESQVLKDSSNPKGMLLQANSTFNDFRAFAYKKALDLFNNGVTDAKDISKYVTQNLNDYSKSNNISYQATTHPDTGEPVVTLIKNSTPADNYKKSTLDFLGLVEGNVLANDTLGKLTSPYGLNLEYNASIKQEAIAKYGSLQNVPDEFWREKAWGIIEGNLNHYSKDSEFKALPRRQQLALAMITYNTGALYHKLVKNLAKYNKSNDDSLLQEVFHQARRIVRDPKTGKRLHTEGGDNRSIKDLEFANIIHRTSNGRYISTKTGKDVTDKLLKVFKSADLNKTGGLHLNEQ
jgi:hypothetical protein